MVFLGLTALPFTAPAAQEIGTVTRVQGTAQLFRQSAEPIMVTRGLAVQRQDRIRTAANSSVRIELADGSILSLGEKAGLKLSDFEYKAGAKRTATMEMTLGKVLVFAKDFRKLKANSFQVKTPTAVVGVRGTLFVVWVQSDTITRVTCYENEVAVYNVFKPGEIVVLPPNSSTDVIRQNPPSKPLLLNEQQLQELRQNMDQAPGAESGPVAPSEQGPVGPAGRAGGNIGAGLSGGTDDTYLVAPGVIDPGVIGGILPGGPAPQGPPLLPNPPSAPDRPN